MPQQSHHKGREREQGKRGPGAERGGKGWGKQSRAGRAGEEQRRWAREKEEQTKHQSTAHASTEVSKERKKHDAPEWSIRSEWEHGPSPRIGSSGADPGATDWSARGNGENTTKRHPGMELPGRNEAQHWPPDWIVRGLTRRHGLERPRRRREYDKKTPRIGATGEE